MDVKVLWILALAGGVHPDDRIGEGLTSFPHDLNPAATVHRITNNLIEYIDFIEPMPNLEQLKMDTNLLAEFPDLENVTTITSLILNDNRLQVVPYDLLDKLTALVQLDLRDNLIYSFPDPPGPKNTLQELFLVTNALPNLPAFANLGESLQMLLISNNEITSCTTELLSHLKVIEKLNLNGNRLSESSPWVPDIRALPDSVYEVRFKANGLSEFDTATLTGKTNLITFDIRENAISSVTGNFFYMDRSNLVSTSLLLDDNPLECDCHSKWLKLAQDLNTPNISGATCWSPAVNNGTAMSALDYAALDCSGETGTRELRATIEVGSYDVPEFDVIATHEVRSVVQCVELCLKQGDCLVFGHIKNEAHLGDNCAITSAGIPPVSRTAPWDGGAVRWYLFE